MAYLTASRFQTVNKTLEQKILIISTAMEAFGNAKTGKRLVSPIFFQACFAFHEYRWSKLDRMVNGPDIIMKARPVY